MQQEILSGSGYAEANANDDLELVLDKRPSVYELADLRFDFIWNVIPAEIRFAERFEFVFVRHCSDAQRLTLGAAKSDGSWTSLSMEGFGFFLKR